ncbi:MAG TPA: hypothetical protein VNJ08_10080 [Bacteriovoracaceae bacterium]|nr:hypothetical protein [Bacteriovoracaceae bacterium]
MYTILLSFILMTFAHADTGYEGKVATLTVELKGLSRNNETLIAGGNIKSSELASGLYFEPKNKLIVLEVPKNCISLVELAFAGNLNFTIHGELSKFNEFYTSSNDVAFEAESAIRCEVVKTK